MAFSIGEKIRSNQYGMFTVLWKSGRCLGVRSDSTGYELTVDVSNAARGSMRDPLHPTLMGLGRVGVGEHKTGTRAHRVWTNVFIRCYREWSVGDVNFTYNLCSVDERWHNFQSFADWYYRQQGCDRFELDKDLLVSGNKVYSPDACVLIPHDINTALQDRQCNSIEGYPGVHFHKKNQNFIAQMSAKGKTSKHIGSFYTVQEARAAYLKVKKEYLVDLANEYKDVIDERAYNALLNWEAY